MRLVLVMACLSLLGCSDPSGPCPYSTTHGLGPDSETPIGSVDELMAPIAGSFLIRPVWTSRVGVYPEPGTMDGLVVTSTVISGRKHEVREGLEDGAAPWCGETRVRAVTQVQIRSTDGAFWAASPDDPMDLPVTFGMAPGLGGPHSLTLPVQRAPEALFDAVEDVEGWRPESFHISMLHPWRFGDGDPTMKRTGFAVYADRTRELPDGPDALISSWVMNGWAWDTEPL